MSLQEKWKLEAPKYGETKTKIRNKKSYYWCPYYAMWRFHIPDNCKVVNIRKENSYNSKNQEEGKKGHGTIFSSTLSTILTIIRYEED